MNDDFNARARALLIRYPDVPPALAGAEFVLVRFRLELAENCHLDRDALFGLRRILRLVGREVLGGGAVELFDPPLSTDPLAVKRFQKAAPAFVLRPNPALAGNWREGDQLELEVLLLGAGIDSLGDFCRVVRALGQRGFPGGGCFELAAVTCLGNDGHWKPLPGAGDRIELTPDLLSVGECLERQLSRATPVLEIVTPLLLLAGGRALRQPRFAQIFPFMLRRVTSMLYYHCNLEPVDDPRSLLRAAAQVDVHWLEIHWQEAGGAVAGREGTPGGMTGRLQLAGEGLPEVLWVVALATLFGAGKGAAYGAGGCRLADIG